MMIPLSNKKVLLLKAIAKYKFLTFNQIIRLGIEKHKANVSKLCKDLRESKRPLIRKIPHNNGEPAKHYLTKRGKEVLLDLCEDIQAEHIHIVPTILYTDTQDQKHRCTTIDIQIALDTTCVSHNLEMLFCDRYFDTVGNNRIDKNLKSKTAFVYEANKSVKADIIFMIQTSKQKELYVLELENGKDTKKAVEKCINHAKAILLKSANEKYHFPQGYRTLWIFEHESIMQATISKLKENSFFSHLTEYFLFKPLSELDQDMTQDWRNIAGQKRKLYYL